MNNGSAAEDTSESPYVKLSTMSSFNVPTSTWVNSSLQFALDFLQSGTLVYFEGIRDAGILVAVGGEKYQGGNSHNFIKFMFMISQAKNDGTSYNIYIYGGIPPTFYSNTSTPTSLNATWILSLPSFTWISGTTSGGFANGRHQMSCELGNNKYLLEHKGRTADYINTCDIDGSICPIHVRDEPYLSFPNVVFNVIGGNSAGGATLLTPSDGFTTNALASVFAKNASAISSHSSAAADSKSSSNAGVIAGGTIGGIAVLGLVVGILLWRKRKAAHFTNANSPSSAENQLVTGNNSGNYGAGTVKPPDYAYELDPQPAVHELHDGAGATVEAPDQIRVEYMT
ncbi:hypothetical protein RUND412_010861 [Rhizina undulata]